jgi:hypothetical protein
MVRIGGNGMGFDVQKKLENLSWNVNKDLQKKTIKELVENNDYDLQLLVFPKDKTCWENAALVLKKKGVQRTVEIVDLLFERLQDMNWPGTRYILELLYSYPKDVFIPAFKFALKKAIESEDDLWLDALVFFLYDGFVSQKEVLDSDTEHIFKQHLSQWIPD